MQENAARGRSKVDDSKKRSSSIGGYLTSMFNGFQEKPGDGVDKDGKIDMQSREGQQKLAKIFKTFDTNGDRQLDA